MNHYFPPQEQSYTYLQTGRGDASGSLWSSMNLDFQSNYGVLRVAPRVITNTTEAIDANLGLPIAYKEFNNSLWALAGARIFRTAASTPEPNELFSVDSSGSAKTNYTEDSDMETFDNRLWTSNDDGLYAKTSYAGAWSLITATPNAGMLQYFRKFNRLYIVQGSDDIASISDADVYAGSGDYTISLPPGFSITCTCETSDSIWIGTINEENFAGQGCIFRWDGVSPQASERYYLNANEVCALVTKDDEPYAVDSNGLLTRFAGSSFDEVGRFPFGFGNKLPKGTGTGTSNQRYIHRRGLTVTKNNTILALIRNPYEDSTDSIPENIPSGVWEWSSDFGLTHKYSLSYTPRESTTITDYGQNKLAQVGALVSMNVGDDSADRNGSLLMGANYYTDGSSGTSTHYGIFYDDSNNLVQKKGYFVTTWFNSFEIQDKWERLWATYRRLLSSTSSLVFKYRLSEEDPVYADITWVDTTHFTTTTDISAYGLNATGFQNSIGGEVEVVQGTGSGSCVHITDVTFNTGTYTVTVDSAVTGVTTGTAKARFQKWIKLNPSEAQNQIKSFSQMAIGQSNTRIQIKGCLTFTGDDEFHKMVLVSNEDITATK